MDNDNKKIDRMQSISLLVISVATLVIIVPGFVGVELPDVVKRVLGIIEVIALPFLSYATVKKVMSRKSNK